MGLIKAALGAAGGVLADQWKEYFYCEAIPANVLAIKGTKKVSGRSSNTSGSENVISSGSGIVVADGQCMIIVEQGKVVEVCAEPGQFTFDASTSPTIFAGGLNIENLKKIFADFGKRFSYGGEVPTDQRVYYINTRELMGNKYGTVNPVPFRVVDQRAGIDIDISVKCFGEYSYHITNPILFYTNVCNNVTNTFTREEIDSQLKSELLTHLQPAFAKISALGVRYSELPGHTVEIAEALNDVLSREWRDRRGIEIASFGVSSIKASEEDEAMIKEMQRNAAFMDPTRAAAHLVGAQADAMKNAANNANGAAMGFMGMNMAQGAGANIQGLYQAGQQQPQQSYSAPAPAPAAAPAIAAGGWTCSCGQSGINGNFCPECGAKKPADANGWTCSCGTVNKGKFCSNCGTKKPAGVPQYKCDKCGWEPEDPTKPPKFCPECGDPFDNADIK